MAAVMNPRAQNKLAPKWQWKYNAPFLLSVSNYYDLRMLFDVINTVDVISLQSFNTNAYLLSHESHPSKLKHRPINFAVATKKWIFVQCTLIILFIQLASVFILSPTFSIKAFFYVGFFSVNQLFQSDTFAVVRQSTSRSIVHSLAYICHYSHEDRHVPLKIGMFFGQQLKMKVFDLILQLLMFPTIMPLSLWMFLWFKHFLALRIPLLHHIESTLTPSHRTSNSAYNDKVNKYQCVCKTNGVSSLPFMMESNGFIIHP